MKNSEPEDRDQFIRLRLLRIVLNGDGMAQRDLKPTLQAGERRELERLGYLEKDFRVGKKRLIGLKLTEDGWGWLNERAVGEFRGSIDGKAMKRLLEAVFSVIAENDLSFSNFAKRIQPAPDPDRPSPTKRSASDLSEQIKLACHRVSQLNHSDRVLLADLRQQLPEVSRDALDSALFDLESKGEVRLYRLDNPMEIRAQDRDAVLRTPTGQERHLIYLGATT